jgi:16S rRNA (cytidine1402-2'-O)-methyltransferase
VTQTPSQPGRLFIVGTPIGNLEDITLRALRMLREVNLIAAEDTRVCRKLLSHYEISTPVISLHAHSSENKIQHIVNNLLAGKKVAYVSDAGMPGISDPGEALVKAAITAGILVIPIPGASAVISALAVSGLNTSQFIFVGFIPRAGTNRRKLLEQLTREPRTVVFYEAPHRLLQTLADLEQVFGDRQAVVARELTKFYEEIRRGKLSELLAYFSSHTLRGEITLLIEGESETAGAIASQPQVATLADAIAASQALLREGMSAKEAARQIAAATGIARRTIYNALQKRSE